MVYATFIPSNDGSTKPSLNYSYQGELTEEERKKFESNLNGSLTALTSFRSREQFDQIMREFDDEFYNKSLL